MATALGWRTATHTLIIGLSALACATTQDAADREVQGRVRADLTECNAAAGGPAYSIIVTPTGRYSFRATGVKNAQRVVDCMKTKGYTGDRVERTTEHGSSLELRPSGGEGGPR